MLKRSRVIGNREIRSQLPRNKKEIKEIARATRISSQMFQCLLEHEQPVAYEPEAAAQKPSMLCFRSTSPSPVHFTLHIIRTPHDLTISQ